MPLLISLLLCHYLADYQLTNRRMLVAKSDGQKILPIIEHAAVHATLMFFVLFVFKVSWQVVLLGFGIELGTHFVIDVSKGCITKRYPVFADMRRKPYWQLYGLDQFLHTLVVLLIYHLANP